MTARTAAIRRIDVTRGIEVGRDVVGEAAAAVAETVARFPVRSRRRSRRRPALIGLAIGIIGAMVLAAWWLRERRVVAGARDERLDLQAVERAAGEGMGTTIKSPLTTLGEPERSPVPMQPTAADARSA